MSFKLGELITDQYGTIGTITQQMEVKLKDYKRGRDAMEWAYKFGKGDSSRSGIAFCDKLKMYPEALRWALISYNGPIKMSANPTTSVWLVHYSNGETWWEGVETLTVIQ